MGKSQVDSKVPCCSAVMVSSSSSSAISAERSKPDQLRQSIAFAELTIEVEVSHEAMARHVSCSSLVALDFESRQTCCYTCPSTKLDGLSLDVTSRRGRQTRHPINAMPSLQLVCVLHLLSLAR